VATLAKDSSVRTRAEDGEPRAANARSARRIAMDSRGERGGCKRDLHHDDYRLSSRAKCLRAAAKGRKVERKG